MSNVTAAVNGNGTMPVASTIVSHFHQRRSITATEANTVNAVVLAASAEVTEDDRTTLFALSDKQTNKILDEFDMVECTAFVDYAFSHNWEYRDGVPELLVKILQVFSYSIASKMLAGKTVQPENISKARNDWQAVACIVGQEVAYGSADCHVLQVTSIEPIATLYRDKNKISDAGVSYSVPVKTTGYLVNGKYTCFANYDIDQVYSNTGKYAGCWFNVTESAGNPGKYVFSCRKVKGDVITRVDKFGNERYSRPNIGIAPTTSFLRTLYGLILSRFVTQERGGIATGHNDLAAETRDCRRAAGVRESDSDFDMVFDSPYFSDNDKNLVKALELTVLEADEYKAETDDLRYLVNQTLKSMGPVWRRNYEAVTNQAIHVRKFQRMVKTLKKTVRRVFNRMAREVQAEMPVAKLKETFVILPDVVDNVPVDYGIQLKARPILKSWEDIWHEVISRPNYHPRPIQTSESIPVTQFPCNVKLDTCVDGIEDLSDVVMTVTKRGHRYNIHGSTGYVETVISWANDRMLSHHLSDDDKIIIELAKIGYGMPDVPKVIATPKRSKATEFWDLIRGQFHRISRVDVTCDYCDCI